MNELKLLTDESLVKRMKTLAGQERRLAAQVIEHLEELDRRKLYLERGFSSLFSFCTKELGYSSDQAMRRMSGMRLSREVPEVRQKIEEGSLSLTNVARVQSFLRDEKKTGKSYSSSEKKALVFQMEGLSTRECERKLATLSPEPSRDRVRAISETETEITFTADEELMRDLEKLRALLSHQSPNYRDLFKRLTKLALTKLDPEAKKSVGAPQVKKDTGSRHIPEPVRRFVWQRDQGQCTYRDPESGRICCSTYQLEPDHIIPWADGGEHTPENLRLLCRAHNQHYAEFVFGAEKISDGLGRHPS